MLFVEWFFVLSGFVLYPQLIKVLNNKKHLFTFYIRRWMRTLPLYLFALLCVSLVTNKLFSIDFFQYLFFIQNMLPKFIQNDYFPVAWSLSIEEYFYLVFPLFLIVIRPENFIKKVMILLVCIMLVKLFFSSMTNLSFYRTGTLIRLDAILIGFVGAHYIDKILKQRVIVILLTLILSVVFLSVRDAVFQGDINNLEKVFFVLLLQAIAFFMLFSFIMGNGFLKHHAFKKLSGLLANQTYSIYLFHLIFLYIIKMRFGEVTDIFFYYLIALFVSSWLIYQFFEKPLLGCRPQYK